MSEKRLVVRTDEKIEGWLKKVAKGGLSRNEAARLALRQFVIEEELGVGRVPRLHVVPGSGGSVKAASLVIE